MKKVKPEVLLVVAVVAILAVFGIGLSIRNILSTAAYYNPQSSADESAQSADSVMGRQTSSELSENPIQSVRAIAGEYIQINDSEEWYKVGDMVEGQALIVAVEPARVLVEWNGRQSWVPFDFSSETEVAEPQQQEEPIELTEQPEEDNQQWGEWANSLTEEQKVQLQQRVMTVMQNWQNLPAEDQARMEQMGQRFQNMTDEERQEAIRRLQPQIQRWLQSGEEELPEFSLD